MGVLKDTWKILIERYLLKSERYLLKILIEVKDTYWRYWKILIEECVGSMQLVVLRHFVVLGHFGLKIVHEILI